MEWRSLICLLVFFANFAFTAQTPSTKETVEAAFAVLGLRTCCPPVCMLCPHSVLSGTEEFREKYLSADVVIDDSSSSTPLKGVWRGHAAASEYFIKRNLQFETSKFTFEITSLDESTALCCVVPSMC